MNCAIYIRKSREDKSKPAHRLTVQREQLPEHARQQGWTPVVYDDGHASAARGKVEDLEQRNRLEADIRAGKIGVILTIELSRLSRDDSMQDYTSWLHLCGQHGVKLATMSRVLDPAQHSDWMLLLMEGGFSSVEMKVLQGRMAEGRREAFRAGKYLSGRPPMPYIYDKQIGGLRIDPEQLKTFNTVVKLAETRSIRSIAEKLEISLTKIRRLTADDRLLFYQASGSTRRPAQRSTANGRPCSTPGRPPPSKPTAGQGMPTHAAPSPACSHVLESCAANTAASCSAPGQTASRARTAPNCTTTAAHRSASAASAVRAG